MAPETEEVHVKVWKLGYINIYSQLLHKYIKSVRMYSFAEIPLRMMKEVGYFFFRYKMADILLNVSEHPNPSLSSHNR